MTIDEILLGFYNSVLGNTDIRHGYPPIHMSEAKAEIKKLVDEIIGEDEDLTGMTGTIRMAYNNRNLLRAEQRARADKLL